VGGQHDDPRFRIHGHDLSRGGKSVHVREVQVHQHHVRSPCGEHRHSGCTGGRVTDAQEVRLAVDRAGQQLGERAVVIDHENS